VRTGRVVETAHAPSLVVTYCVEHAPHCVLQLVVVTALGHLQSNITALVTTHPTDGVKQSNVVEQDDPIVAVIVGHPEPPAEVDDEVDVVVVGTVVVGLETEVGQGM
jgi:hypothetical protein